MSPTFKRGLVVGKFSPLHHGHEWLLQVAQQHCAELIVISYSVPEFERCEAPLRREWLAKRFPHVHTLVIDPATWLADCLALGLAPMPIPANDADAELHRSFVGWLCRHRLRLTVDAVFTSEDYGDGFAASLTRQFRVADPGHAEVVHVCVDRQRTRFPVSGTQVRADLHRHLHNLSPHVLSNLIPRIALLGGESSGKTTLARALAERLGTVWVPEYGRQLWEERRQTLSVDELLQVARTQIAWEDEHATRARGWLVCDTTPLTTLQYCLHDHGQAPAELHHLAQRRYDLTVLCLPDFDFVQDGCRRDDDYRLRQHSWTLARLAEHGVVPLQVRGDVQTRLAQVLAQLPSHSGRNFCADTPA